MPTDRVIIRNKNWAHVEVQARRGNNAVIEDNPSLDDQTLMRHGSWPIDSDGENVYYRRNADPDHPNGQMTEWTERPCYGTGETFLEEI